MAARVVVSPAATMLLRSCLPHEGVLCSTHFLVALAEEVPRTLAAASPS